MHPAKQGSNTYMILTKFGISYIVLISFSYTSHILLI